MTSKNAYFGNGRADVVNTEFVLDQFGSRNDFELFLEEEDDITHLEVGEPKISEEDLRKRICEVAGISHPTNLKSLEKSSRDLALAKIMSSGVSERRVERATGISRGTIRRAMRK